MDYTVFSDESYITSERYRSIAAASFLTSFLFSLNSELSDILDSSDVSCFNWQKLRSAKYRWCAEKLIRISFAESFFHAV